MKTTIKVEGMMCAHCEAAVNGALMALDGVESAVVDLGAGTVTVSYDPDRVNQAAMAEAIEEQGYDVAG